MPSASGMSSISVLFTVDWDEHGTRHHADLVARLAPESTALPVFPEYDLERQAAVMRAVAAHSAVPVPGCGGSSRRPTSWGKPFVVMDRVEGVVPVDNPPYVFGGWLHEATSEQCDVLQRGSVEVLAAIHSIPDPGSLLPELGAGAADDALRRHVDNERTYYEWTHREDGVRIPLLEEGFRLARGTLAERSVGTGAVLGRLPYRQHHVSGLRACGRTRLGARNPRSP